MPWPHAASAATGLNRHSGGGGGRRRVRREVRLVVMAVVGGWTGCTGGVGHSPLSAIIVSQHISSRQRRKPVAAGSHHKHLEFSQSEHRQPLQPMGSFVIAVARHFAEHLCKREHPVTFFQLLSVLASASKANLEY